MQADALEVSGMAQNVEGWVRFDDVGALIATSQANPYAILPFDEDAAGWFDDVKKWVKKAKKTAGKALQKVRSGALTVLDSSIGQAAQNYLSLIPGYGTAIAAGLGGLRSALKGNPWSQVLLDAAAKAVPGKLGQSAIGAAKGALDAVLAKKGLRTALMGAAMGAAPAALGGLLPSGASKSAIVDAVRNVVGAQGAQSVANALVNAPALRGLATRELAKRLNVPPAIAQAGQAALLRHMAPSAPAFPAGASLDTAGAWIASTAHAVPNADVRFSPGPPPTLAALTPAGAKALHACVPNLQDADRHFVGLALRGAAARPRVRLLRRHDTAGLEGAKYVVEKGDYYAKIASKLGHPGEVSALIKANPSIPSPYTIYPKQLLNVPSAWLASMPAPPAPAPSPSPLPTPPAPAPSMPSGGKYVVKPGDTMQSIATKFGHPKDVLVLIKANPQVKDPNRIYPGDELNIPTGWSGEAPQAPPSAPAPTPPQSLPELPPSELPELPDWHIPGTPPADYQLPDGTVETFPGEAYQDKRGPEVWARVQTSLAAWNRATPGACTPADYGLPSDWTGVWDERTKSALSSYQKWANSHGESLRTDGVLDAPTETSLAKTLANILAQKVPPKGPEPSDEVPSLPPVISVPPMPTTPTPSPTPAPTPSTQSAETGKSTGALLLSLVPLAAAFLG